MHIAHINEWGELQSVKCHSENTAALAKSYAIFPLQHCMYAMGLLHDVGKYQLSFQKKIMGDNALKIAHAVCGAREVEALFGVGLVQIVMQYCIWAGCFK